MVAVAEATAVQAGMVVTAVVGTARSAEEAEADENLHVDMGSTQSWPRFERDIQWMIGPSVFLLDHGKKCFKPCSHVSNPSRKAMMIIQHWFAHLYARSRCGLSRHGLPLDETRI